MSQLAELDKLGQEGAAPLNDAEVQLPDCRGDFLVTSASNSHRVNVMHQSILHVLVKRADHSWHTHTLTFCSSHAAGTKD